MLHDGECSERTHASALGVQNPIANAYLILGISVWTCAAGVLTQVGTTILK